MESNSPGGMQKGRGTGDLGVMVSLRGRGNKKEK